MQTCASCAYYTMSFWRRWRTYAARIKKAYRNIEGKKKSPIADRQRACIYVSILCSHRPSYSHASTALLRAFQHIRLCLYVFSICGVTGLLCRFTRPEFALYIIPRNKYVIYIFRAKIARGRCLRAVR